MAVETVLEMRRIAQAEGAGEVGSVPNQRLIARQTRTERVSARRARFGHASPQIWSARLVRPAARGAPRRPNQSFPQA
jgi:hypothetical protein